MLDKRDKKFIAALIFAQTGLVMMTISFSAYFWHHTMVRLQGMEHLYNFSKILKSINYENDFEKQKKCTPKEQEQKQEQKKIIM